MSEFADEVGDHNGVNSKMHWAAMIERVWTCTWSLWANKDAAAHGGYNRVNIEMHSKALIETIWRCSCWLRSSEIGGEPAGGWSSGRRLWWRCEGSWCSLYWIACNCGNVKSWLQQHPPSDEKLIGSKRLSILGWCCPWYMLYSVLPHDHGMERYRGKTWLCVLRWW